MYQLRGLTIDNGGSEIRILPYGKEVPDGMTRMVNDFVQIKNENFRWKETESVLDLCNIKEAPKKEYIGIMARGMTAKMYDGEGLTITSQSTKTGSLNYYRQFVYAVARDAIQAVLDEENKVEEEETKSKLFKPVTQSRDLCIFDYIIVTCIPIKEHSGKIDCASKLKEQLFGDYVVEFPLLQGKTNVVKFRIRSEFVGVVPEGGVAMTQLRDTVSEDDITLVVDMGHITTDIALFKGRTLFGNRVISSPFAGSTLIANVRAVLADEGYSLNEEQIARVIETGRVKRGAGTVDVSNIITEQKRLFVRNFLKTEVVQLLNMNGFNAMQVQNVVPIGAPMNGEGKSSIAHELIKECNLSAATIRLLAKDLRYVNLEQASKFTKVLYQQAAKAIKVARPTM